MTGHCGQFRRHARTWNRLRAKYRRDLSNVPVAVFLGVPGAFKNNSKLKGLPRFAVFCQLGEFTVNSQTKRTPCSTSDVRVLFKIQRKKFLNHFRNFSAAPGEQKRQSLSRTRLLAETSSYSMYDVSLQKYTSIRGTRAFPQISARVAGLQLETKR